MARRPIRGLTELIWNALDADADVVYVDVEHNSAGGIDAIAVTDDGHGMPPDEATREFSHLGGSWKLTAETTRTKHRTIHGSSGEGRWTGFALGGSEVRWETVAEVNGEHLLTIIRILRDAPTTVEISEPITMTRGTGTIVRVEGISQEPKGVFSEAGGDALTASFALHLRKYPTIKLVVDGQHIDPASLISKHQTMLLDVQTAHGPAELDVVEWSSRDVSRVLYFCDERGMALSEGKVGIQAPRYRFSAYIRWRGFSVLQDELGLEELEHPDFTPVISAARDALRRYFKERDLERAGEVVQAWKGEHSYPYSEPPKDETERVEHELFELIAVTAADAVNAGRSVEARKFSLGLMRAALESGPGALRRVLENVLRLPLDQLALLDDLLSRTTLTNVIKTSRMICDRLDFLDDLEDLVNEAEAREHLAERRHLHRIVEQETWIFGEQYAVVSSDRSLTQCLKQYRATLGEVGFADEEPVTLDGRRQVIDLLLWRPIPQGDDRRQFLVVELKRPSVRVGRDELGQLEDYARAVMGDTRFSDTETSWDFILVSTEINPNIDDRRRQTDRVVGHVTKSERYNLWVLTWAQVVQAARHRLKFVESGLRLDAAGQSPLAYVRSKYGALLPAELRGDLPGTSAPPRPDPRRARKERPTVAPAAAAES
jgi:hypothetical protein